MRASLQTGFTASDKVDDFGVARDDNGLLAILVFDLQRVPSTFCTCCATAPRPELENGQKSHRRDRTAWLGMEDSNRQM
jgi:hypothetical protein